MGKLRDEEEEKRRGSNTRVNCNVRRVTWRGKKVKPSALLEHSSHALLMEGSIETKAKTRKRGMGKGGNNNLKG